MKASTLLFTFVCCLALLSCRSQSTKSRKKTNSILWEISGKGLKQKSYLLGTHHIVNYHFLDSIPQFQSIMDNVDAGRNKKWIPVIKSNIQECPCLIAVGAGHLPGKEGLINLLRKEGYRVKPIDIYAK